MERSKVKIIFVLIVGTLLSAGAAYLAVFGRALAQPENHARIFCALPQAMVDKSVAIGDGKYFSKDSGPFIEEMAKQGFVYVERMGSGYFFTKEGESYISTGRMYSSHFMLFSLPEKN